MKTTSCNLFYSSGPIGKFNISAVLIAVDINIDYIGAVFVAVLCFVLSGGECKHSKVSQGLCSFLFNA